MPMFEAVILSEAKVGEIGFHQADQGIGAAAPFSVNLEATDRQFIPLSFSAAGHAKPQTGCRPHARRKAADEC